MKRLILTDQSSFKDIREQSAVYIDKTKQIYATLERGKFFFFARPRRFGKSLLCSTLVELFKGNRALFKDLWIDNSDWQWQAHPVIHLDMSIAAGSNATVSSFNESIKARLADIAKEYNVQTRSFELPGGQLAELIKVLHEATGVGVAVIVDEYDKPILDKVTSMGDYEQLHSALSSFYAPLKYLSSSLSLVFMTGVYKFAKTSVFSNLNNLRDLTFDPRAADLVGYTQEELESIFSAEIDVLAAKKQVTRTAMLATLREQYNGYKFGLELTTGTLSQSVYNSFAMNHVFESSDLVEKWFPSGSPSFLIKKIKEGNFEFIAQEGITTSFKNLDESCGPENISAVSLLYYAGYATLSSYDVESKLAVLMSPNSEVSEAMAGHLLALFKKSSAADLELIAWQLAQSFRFNTLDLIKDQLNQALAQLTYKVLLGEEHYFQLMMHMLLIIGRLNPQLEKSTNHGRMDMVIELPTRIFIIELKFNKSAQEGMNQIKAKKYVQKYQVKSLPIMGVGINIALKGNNKPEGGDNRCVFDVVFEQLH
jgi:hypothetical protein